MRLVDDLDEAVPSLVFGSFGLCDEEDGVPATVHDTVALPTGLKNFRRQG